MQIPQVPCPGCVSAPFRHSTRAPAQLVNATSNAGSSEYSQSCFSSMDTSRSRALTPIARVEGPNEAIFVILYHFIIILLSSYSYILAANRPRNCRAQSACGALDPENSRNAHGAVTDGVEEDGADKCANLPQINSELTLTHLNLQLEL